MLRDLNHIERSRSPKGGVYSMVLSSVLWGKRIIEVPKEGFDYCFCTCEKRVVYTPKTPKWVYSTEIHPSKPWHGVLVMESVATLTEKWRMCNFNLWRKTRSFDDSPETRDHVHEVNAVSTRNSTNSFYAGCNIRYCDFNDEILGNCAYTAPKSALSLRPHAP